MPFLDAMSPTPEDMLHTVTHATHQWVQQAADQAQTSFVNQTVRRAGDLSGSMMDSLLERSGTLINAWVSQHPLVGWFLMHPLISALALLLSLSLLWTLIGLFGRLMQQTWLAILGAPLALLVWLGRQLVRQFQGAIARRPSSANSSTNSPDQPDRVTAILMRLEHLRQEQDTLLTELKGLLEQAQERAKEPR